MDYLYSFKVSLFFSAHRRRVEQLHLLTVVLPDYLLFWHFCSSPWTPRHPTGCPSELNRSSWLIFSQILSFSLRSLWTPPPPEGSLFLLENQQPPWWAPVAAQVTRVVPCQSPSVSVCHTTRSSLVSLLRLTTRWRRRRLLLLPVTRGSVLPRPSLGRSTVWVSTAD